MLFQPAVQTRYCQQTKLKNWNRQRRVASSEGLVLFGSVSWSSNIGDFIGSNLQLKWSKLRFWLPKKHRDRSWYCRLLTNAPRTLMSTVTTIGLQDYPVNVIPVPQTSTTELRDCLIYPKLEMQKYWTDSDLVHRTASSYINWSSLFTMKAFLSDLSSITAL